MTTSKARQITDDEVRVLKKLGFGDRIETRFYLHPTKQSALKQPALKSSDSRYKGTSKYGHRSAPTASRVTKAGQAYIELTEKECAQTMVPHSGERTLRSRVYQVCEKVLTTPGTHTVTRYRMCELIVAEEGITWDSASSTLSLLIYNGHVRYVKDRKRKPLKGKGRK